MASKNSNKSNGAFSKECEKISDILGLVGSASNAVDKLTGSLKNVGSFSKNVSEIKWENEKIKNAHEELMTKLKNDASKIENDYARFEIVLNEIKKLIEPTQKIINNISDLPAEALNNPETFNAFVQCNRIAQDYIDRINQIK